MVGCIPNSLFLSEVLVILSSCVFVVMALLTAVVSVTSITFIDRNEQSTEHHSNLPNRFSVRSGFDLPSYSSFFPELGSMNENQNPVFKLLRFFILSSLRDSLIEKDVILNNRILNIISDNFNQIINASLKVYEDDYNISTVPLYVIYNLLSKRKSIEYLPTFSRTQSSKLRFNFEINSSSFLFDIESIKSNLFNRSKPVSLSIPFDLVSFLQHEKDSSFLQESTYVYLIYGWNDDFLFKIPSISSNDYLTGGFIARQFIREIESHSISYYYGNLSSYEENLFCPQLSEHIEFSNLSRKMQLICKDKKKCNTSSSYYLLQSQDNNIDINIQNDSTFNIGFIEYPEKGFSKKVYLNFDKIEDIHSSFTIKNKQMNEQCNYLFIPYDILKKIFSYSKTTEQMAFGISSSIHWSYSEFLDLSEYTIDFSERPSPFFEI